VNPLGIHALVWVDGWSEAECSRALSLTKETGFDLIEIPLLDPGTVDAMMTRRLLEKHGLGASCSLGLGFDTDVSSADPATAARGENLLEAAVDVTAAIGASFLGGVVYSAMGKYGEAPTETGRRHCVEALRRVAEQAEAKEITIGVEPVNRYESNLVNTAAQALELIEEVGAANLVVHLDSYHMNIEETDPAEAIRLCGRRLGYVHLGESHRGYLGTGTVDFPGLFRALAAAGYAGPLTFESFSTAVISARFASALAIWREPWQDGCNLALDARRFVEAQLREAAKA
jgi:D-psicose/D-tagatose/L-ribulose 3-epimerase